MCLWMYVLEELADGPHHLEDALDARYAELLFVEVVDVDRHEPQGVLGGAFPYDFDGA